MKKQMPTARKKIQKAVIELLKEKEVEQLKVSQICRVAGINRSTFYTNYEDCNDMVSQLREYIVQYYEKLFSEKNSLTFLHLLKNIADNQDTYRLFFHLHLDDNLSSSYHFSHWLVYPSNSNQYDRVFIHQAVNAVIRKWLNLGCPESPEEINALITNKLVALGLKNSQQ